MFSRSSMAIAEELRQVPGLGQVLEPGELAAPLLLDPHLTALDEGDLVQRQDPRDVLADRERDAGLDRRRGDDLHPHGSAEGDDAARDDRVLVAQPVAGLAGEVVAEMGDPRRREEVLGPHHVLGEGLLDPDAAVGIDGDLVDVVGEQQVAQLAQVVLRIAGGRRLDRLQASKHQIPVHEHGRAARPGPHGWSAGCEGIRRARSDVLPSRSSARSSAVSATSVIGVVVDHHLRARPDQRDQRRRAEALPRSGYRHRRSARSGRARRRRCRPARRWSRPA